MNLRDRAKSAENVGSARSARGMYEMRGCELRGGDDYAIRIISCEGCARIAWDAPWADSVTGGEACGYLCSEKEGFTHPWLWRAPCFWGTHELKLHAGDTYVPAF
jgi:hypothetical protein